VQSGQVTSRLDPKLRGNSIHPTRGLHFHDNFGNTIATGFDGQKFNWLRGADERVVKVNEIRRLKQWPLTLREEADTVVPRPWERILTDGTVADGITVGCVIKTASTCAFQGVVDVVTQAI